MPKIDPEGKGFTFGAFPKLGDSSKPPAEKPPADEAPKDLFAFSSLPKLSAKGAGSKPRAFPKLSPGSAFALPKLKPIKTEPEPKPFAFPKLSSGSAFALPKLKPTKTEPAPEQEPSPDAETSVRHRPVDEVPEHYRALLGWSTGKGQIVSKAISQMIVAIGQATVADDNTMTASYMPQIPRISAARLVTLASDFIENAGNDLGLDEMGSSLAVLMATYWQGKGNMRESIVAIKTMERNVLSGIDKHNALATAIAEGEPVTKGSDRAVEAGMHVLITAIAMLKYVRTVTNEHQKHDYLKFVEVKVNEVRQMLPDDAQALLVLADRVEFNARLMMPRDKRAPGEDPDITQELNTRDLEFVDEDALVDDPDVPLRDDVEMLEESDEIMEVDGVDIVEEPVARQTPPPVPPPVLPPPVPAQVISSRVAESPREEEGSVLGNVIHFLGRGVGLEDWNEFIRITVEHSFEGDWDRARIAAERYGFNIDAWRADEDGVVSDKVDRLDMRSPTSNMIYNLARAKDGFNLNEANARTLAIHYTLLTMFKYRKHVPFRADPQDIKQASKFLENMGFYNTLVSKDQRHPTGYRANLLDRIADQIDNGFVELVPVQLTVELAQLWWYFAEGGPPLPPEHPARLFFAKQLAEDMRSAVGHLFAGDLPKAASIHRIDWNKLPPFVFGSSDGSMDSEVVKALHHLAMVALLKETALVQKGVDRRRTLETAWKAMYSWKPPRDMPHSDSLLRYAYENTSWDIVQRLISPHERELVNSANNDIPGHTSMTTTERLVSYLITYWKNRGDVLRKTKDGDVARDYVAILEGAERDIRVGRELLEKGPSASDPTVSLSEIVQRISYAAMQLDGSKVDWFAPGLKEPALSLVRAFHDLARGLILYKASPLEPNPARRLEMLTANNGARQAIAAAQDWFQGTGTPGVIRDYARFIAELKINPSLSRGTSGVVGMSTIARNMMRVIGGGLERSDYDVGKGMTLVAGGLSTYWGEIASEVSMPGVGSLSAQGLSNMFKEMTRSIRDGMIGNALEPASYIWFNYGSDNPQQMLASLMGPNRTSIEEQYLISGLHALSAAYVMNELKRFPPGELDERKAVGIALNTVEVAGQYLGRVKGVPASIDVFRKQLETSIGLRFQRINVVKPR